MYAFLRIYVALPGLFIFFLSNDIILAYLSSLKRRAYESMRSHGDRRNEKTNLNLFKGGFFHGKQIHST